MRAGPRFRVILATWLTGPFLLQCSSEQSGEIAVQEDDQIVARQVEDILEMRKAGLELYGKAAKKVATHAGANCLMGGLFGFLTGGVQGGALGCKVAAGLIAVTTALDEVTAHWSEQMRRAMKVWRLYTWSFKTLECDPWEIQDSEKKYRQCALKHHPDKLSRDADQEKLDYHAEKFANCRFAGHYIRAFRKKYGEVDFSQVPHRTQFLKDFAGVWATTFAPKDRMRDSEIDELARRFEL